jgi:hypothetical protein
MSSADAGEVQSGSPWRATPDADRRRLALAVALVALVCFLPFLRGLWAGHCFYFRDLSVHFFPLRSFVVGGLLEGEVRYWNPLLHEGVPSPLPPVSYPFDLLQLLVPSEWGFSLLLALHVPLAAAAFLLLARSLGLTTAAGVGGGVIYALGGFSLSTMNFYVYLSALAWAPVLVQSLRAAIVGGWRLVPVAAFAGAVSLSTAGAEIVFQAILIALVLGLRSRRPAEAGRAGASIALAVGLAAPTLFVMGSLVSQTERGQGFPTDVVLAHSVHPLSYVQVLVGSWHGDATSLTDRWWGQNFFPQGFPYVLSLYLGATALALAAVGLLCGGRLRTRIGALLLVAALVALGRWGGLRPLIDAVPALHLFRYPVKAFFTVHFAVALLASMGLDALGDSRRRAARWMATVGLALGGLLVALLVVPVILPTWVEWFAGGFFPSGHSPALRAERLSFVLRDAAVGGGIAIASGAVGLAIRTGRLRAGLGVTALLGLLSGDLLRTGASLNPMVSPSFYRLSPEMTAAAEEIRSRGGRIFTCRTEDSPAYWTARRLRHGAHEVWTFATNQEALSPNFNMMVGLPSALSEDLTSLVPTAALPPLEFQCSRIGGLIGRLRDAAVTHVLSLDPLEHPDLTLLRIATPQRIAPLAVHVYALRDPLPVHSLTHRPPATSVDATAASDQAQLGRLWLEKERPGRVVLSVEATEPAAVRFRQSCVPGWTATVDGATVPLLPQPAGHCAVPVPTGKSRVELVYRPPGLVSGLFVMGISVLANLTLAWSTRRAGREAARR